MGRKKKGLRNTVLDGSLGMSGDYLYRWPYILLVTPLSLHFSDCGCVYGVQPDPAMHIFSTGCPEEQQAF